jgi:hypothetical protein
MADTLPKGQKPASCATRFPRINDYRRRPNSAVSTPIPGVFPEGRRVMRMGMLVGDRRWAARGAQALWLWLRGRAGGHAEAECGRATEAAASACTTQDGCP